MLDFKHIWHGQLKETELLGSCFVKMKIFKNSPLKKKNLSF